MYTGYGLKMTLLSNLPSAISVFLASEPMSYSAFFLKTHCMLEKEMSTHSSILAWRIPWTEELGKIQSAGVTAVRPDLAMKQSPQ